MKILLAFLFSFFTISKSNAQKNVVTSNILSSIQIEETFTSQLIKELKLDFPIKMVYEYSDKTGKYYCLLSESAGNSTLSNDTLIQIIKVVNYKIEKNNFSKVWEINDSISKDNLEEKSISFWTNHFEIKDFDNDSIAEIVSVYGTVNEPVPNESRITINIFYKNQKATLKKIDYYLAFEVTDSIDISFYELPQVLQQAIKNKMAKMEKNKQVVLPKGWQSAMKRKDDVIHAYYRKVPKQTGDLTCVFKEKYNAAQRREFYPFNISETIKLVSFRYQKNNYPIDDSLVKEDSLIETKTLSPLEIDKLTDILYNNFNKKKANFGYFNSCFMPRNAILFYDHSGKLKEYILICFHCDNYNSSSDNVMTGDNCYQKTNKLMQFFKESGLKFGTNKTIEKYPGEDFGVIFDLPVEKK